jgi:hypothetical protein
VTQRDRIVLMVVAAAVALGGFWMLALKPKRQESARLGKQLAQAQQRADVARTEMQAGDAARNRYATNYATVARLGKAVPVDDDVPALVYQLDSTAKDVGVDFRTIKLTADGAAKTTPPNAAQSAAATQDKSQDKAASQNGEDAGANASKDQAASGQKGSDSGSGSGAQTASTSPPAAAPTQAATAGLPPGAVVGPAGLNTMPFTFTFEGSFFKLSDFLTKLERYIKASRRTVDVRGRLLMIDGISLNAAPKGFPSMTAAIAAQAYLLPTEQGLFDGASPTGPSAVTAQPASDTGAASPVAPATVTP